jgi:acetyl esterase/lipase
MKSFFFVFTLLAIWQTASFGQKPPIDISALENWPEVQSSSITKNGKFIVYSVQNQPAGKKTTIITAIKSKWKKEFVSLLSSEARFTINDKYCIIKSEDTLRILKNGTDEMRVYTGVELYKGCINNQLQWLSYTLKSSSGVVHLINMNSDKETVFEHVKNYQFSTNGHILLIQTETELQFVDMMRGTKKTIWEGHSPREIVWHRSEDEVFFLTGNHGTQGNKSILFQYKPGFEKAEPITDDLNSLYEDYKADGIAGISMDGNRIFLNFVENKVLQPVEQKKNVTIFNYLDQSFITNPLYATSLKKLTYCFNISSKKYLQVKSDEEEIKFFLSSYNDTIAIVSNLRKMDVAETNKYTFSIRDYYLISTVTGQRKKTTANFSTVSPSGKYLVGYNDINQDIILYDINKAEEYNITQDLLNQAQKGRSRYRSNAFFTTIAWLPNDSGMLISDEFDLWKAYPTRKRNPVNITNGYCFRNNIKTQVLGHQIWDFVFRGKDNHIILSASNNRTKENGFIRANLLKNEDPHILVMGPFTWGGNPYNFSSMGQIWSESTAPNQFLIGRDGIKESLNFYLTADFVTFKQISDVFPERKYNWLTSELVSYQSDDSINTQMVIYKPENFRADKKYPIIFYYYEMMSEKMNEYHRPKLCNGGINIPWFVSNGYVVCTPDINNIHGNPAKTALDVVMGAYNYLKKEEWYDPHKAAICGHSFGGFETNYILAHSDVFAAAYSGASISDLISYYGSTRVEGTFNAINTEIGQFRFNGTMWDKKQIYIENSAVLDADKVVTPVLLMANVEDRIVPFTQTVELFTGLRRLGKKVWLLSYEGEGHTIESKNNQIDFTLKLTGYIDHYLKGTPVSEWMIYKGK